MSIVFIYSLPAGIVGVIWSSDSTGQVIVHSICCYLCELHDIMPWNQYEEKIPNGIKVKDLTQEIIFSEHNINDVGRLTGTIYVSVRRVKIIEAIIGWTNGFFLFVPKPLFQPMFDYVNWEMGNRYQWNVDQNSYVFLAEKPFKMSCAKLQTSCPSLNALTLRWSSSFCNFVWILVTIAANQASPAMVQPATRMRYQGMSLEPIKNKYSWQLYLRVRVDMVFIGWMVAHSRGLFRWLFVHSRGPFYLKYLLNIMKSYSVCWTICWHP